MYVNVFGGKIKYNSRYVDFFAAGCEQIPMRGGEARDNNNFSSGLV